MPKTVLLLRHGKADPSERGGTDHDRPLNERGRRDVEKVGARLVERGITVDGIVSSTSVRTYGTATLLAHVIGHDPDAVRLEKRLYLAEPEEYKNVLIETSQRVAGASGWGSILLVGHNPGMSQLASEWASDDIEMPTAALAHFQFSVDDWAELRGAAAARLLELLIAREA